MLISIFLMLTQATATPVAPATLQPDPVINVCPSEPAAIPPFSESCAAKEQAARVSAILGVPARPLRPERYKIINDGKVIADERGDIIATASPCLLPQAEPQDEALASSVEPAKASSAVEPCQTHKFAMQFSTPASNPAMLAAEPKVAPKP